MYLKSKNKKTLLKIPLAVSLCLVLLLFSTGANGTSKEINFQKTDPADNPEKYEISKNWLEYNILGAGNQISVTPFSFTVCGDNRPADDFLPPPETYFKILDLISKEDTILHITVGDIINGGTSEEEIIVRQFSDYLEVSKKLPVINFIVPGNHDLTNKTTRRYFREMILKKTLLDAIDSGIDVYLPGKEKFSGSTEKEIPLEYLYYYFEFNDIYFVVLNAYQEGHWGAIESGQLEWLEEVLRKFSQEVVFIFLHPPPYSVLNPDTDSAKHLAFSSKGNLYHIRQTFKKYKVDAVFSGHEHVYNKQVHDGTHYVITALSGEYPYFSEEEGGFYHYIRIDVGKESWSYNVIKMDGEVYYQEEIEFN